MVPIVTSSFADAWPVFMAQRGPHVMLGVIAAVGSLGIIFFGDHRFHDVSPEQVAVLYVFNFGSVIGQPFAIAAALRTANPDFKMTPAKLCLGFFVYLVTACAAALASYLLVWPGIWVLTKLSLAYAAYETDLERPFHTSWNLTTGAFWETLAVLALTNAIGLFIVFFVLIVAVFASVLFPPCTVVFAPAAMLAYFWFSGFSQLVAVRWLAELRAFHAASP